MIEKNKIKLWILKGCLVGCPLFLVGCVSLEAPQDEYNLARTAYLSARGADAKRYAPVLFFKAEKYYKNGEKKFKDRRYKEALKLFRVARSYSERSENVARVKQFTSDGGM